MTLKDFALPDLGEGLTEAEVVRWLVAVGDAVAVDEVVAEVETAKASVEVPCPYSGTVATLHARPGQTVAVGAPLLSVEEAAQESSGPVLVGYGTQPSRRAAPPAGSDDGSLRPRPAPRQETTPRQGPGGSSAARTPVVSPLVRRMAREYGLDAAALAGSGEGGLVLRRDVEAAISRTAQTSEDATEPGPAHGGAQTAQAATPAGGGPQRIALRGVQRAMAERLARSRREIPEATVWVEADVTELLAARTDIDRADPQHPVSVQALLARFCVLGLESFPALNSSVDETAGEVLRFSQVNLGIATQTPRGLLVPVIHGAEALRTRALAAALRETVEAARAGTLPADRLGGGTFTVNNYGVFGVDGSAPIINHPEAAMLGMGRIARRPWVVGEGAEERLEPRSVTTLTLVFDHRVCDGAAAGGFLRFVADCVERPRALLGGL